MTFDQWWNAVGQYELKQKSRSAAETGWDACTAAGQVYCAYVDEVPSLSLEPHEIAHEVSTAEVVQMWGTLKALYESLRRDSTAPTPLPPLGLRAPEGELLKDIINRATFRGQLQWLEDAAEKRLDYGQFQQGSFDIHQHVFDHALTEGPPPRVYALFCSCGETRRIGDFAGPDIYAGLKVRLTARGRRIIEQTASEIEAALRPAPDYIERGAPPTPNIMPGDEGRIMLSRIIDTDLWECQFSGGYILVNAEMVTSNVSDDLPRSK